MNLTALQSKVYLLTKTNSTSFESSDLNQALNNALERIVQLINIADQRWEWDDTNQTDLPNATTDLVSGQQDYSLSTSFLSIDRVEVKDSAGNWWLLRPVDQHDVRYVALANYYPNQGRPIEYDKLANTIFLYPTPNYAGTASLKLYFTRAPVALVNGSDIPGINSLFHDLLAYQVAYEYAIANGLDSANGFFTIIEQKEQSLKDFYNQRSRDERPRFGISTNGKSTAVSGVIGSIWGDSNR